jgi:hypothetical protein
MIMYQFLIRRIYGVNNINNINNKRVYTSRMESLVKELINELVEVKCSLRDIRLEYEKLKEDHARLLAGSEEKKSKPEKRETLEDIYKKVSSESVADEFDIDEVERELKNELVGSVIETEVSPAVEEKNLIIVNESDANRKAYMRKYMKERRIKKKAAPAAPPS